MMTTFWKGVLAFSISVNLAGAATITSQKLAAPTHECSGECPWRATTEDLLWNEEDSIADLEEMRRSFDSFRETCKCDIRALRHQLVAQIATDDPDLEELESVLQSMCRHQLDLQRRLVEQIIAERAALGEESRQVFDERLKQRLMAGSEHCPHGRGN